MKFGELKHINKYQAKCSICGAQLTVDVPTRAEAIAGLELKGWTGASLFDNWRCRACSGRLPNAT